jgi:group I intron endonuclease
MIIYKLTSPENKVYIGLTTRSLEKRIRGHICDWSRGKRSCPKLFDAFNKFPPSTWKIDIIYSTNNKDILLKKEIEFIQLYNSVNVGYNTSLGGELGQYGIKVSDATKEKIRQARLGKPRSQELRDLISKYKKGIKLSDEHKRKLSHSHLGKKYPNQKPRKPVTLEIRNRISLKNRGQTRSSAVKEKMRLAKLGTKQSFETIEKIRKYRIGQPVLQKTRDKIAQGIKLFYKLKHEKNDPGIKFVKLTAIC